MLITKIRQAASSLLIEPAEETDTLRRWARQAVQTATVMLALLLFTAALGPGFARLGESSELARLLMLVALAIVYGALYVAASRVHRRAAAAWSSAALVVIELSLLITLIPLLALVVGPLLPKDRIEALTNEGNMFFELAFFLGLLVFTMRGWGRYIERAAHAAAAQQEAAFYERLAHQDPLTGLANRRRFEKELAARLETDALSTTGVLMIDVDRFKQINDNFSHDTGDEVLKAIAQVLQRHVCAPDLPARLAGDEFVALLGQDSSAQAESLASKLCEAVRRYDWHGLHPDLKVSVSIGAATTRAGDTLSTLMRRSDAQMYQAKREPRTVSA